MWPQMLRMLFLPCALLLVPSASQSEVCQSRFDCEVPETAQACQSRLDCVHLGTPSTCNRDYDHEEFGYCQQCSLLNASLCQAPCQMVGSACEMEAISVALDLDLQPPHFAIVFLAVSKAVLQLWAFPPTRTGDFRGLQGTAKMLAQWAFAAMAAVTFLADVRSVFSPTSGPPLTIREKLLMPAAVLGVSPNLHAGVGAALQVKMAGGPVAENLGAFGGVFKVYALCLMATYGLLFLALLLFVSLSAVIYCYVILVDSALGWPICYYLAWMVIPHFFGRGDLAVGFEKRQDQPPTTMTKFLYYLMLVPTVQYLTLVQVRLLDGWGYFGALNLVTMERNASAYLAAVGSSPWHAFLLLWRAV